MPKPSKNTRIYKFVQGEKDSELFAKVGHWCVSPEVHKRLGIAVSALPGDVWYVNDSGFLQARTAKNGSVHIRFLFTADEKDTVNQESLIKSVLSDNEAAELVFTNDRKDSKIWKKFKFTPVEKEKGTFCRWEKKSS
ncbi:MAG: hypothetical protein LBQ54_07520 [Planctomycetaceae bacterium]|nr:hypothetical protein [Planctomycetaceae bacterium]